MHANHPNLLIPGSLRTILYSKVINNDIQQYQISSSLHLTYFSSMSDNSLGIVCMTIWTEPSGTLWGIDVF